MPDIVVPIKSPALSIVLNPYKSHLTIAPARGATPLCYFLWEESNAKALSHCRPVVAGSMKVLLRAPAGMAGAVALIANVK